MRLIDADVLWDVFREKQNSLTARCGGYRFLDSEDRAKYDRLEITLAHIENASEVDAVPVVRCRECKRFERHTEVDTECGGCYPPGKALSVRTVHENDYCSYGERRK